MVVRPYEVLIKDPVHGYIPLNELENKLVDTAPLQRLRRIRQLAGSEYVYPGANHTRFEHSLGVMYLARLLAQALPVELTEDEKMALEVSGLLHDVGHGPFSHIFEALLVKHLNKTHEDITAWIVAGSEIADVLRDQGFDPTVISKLAVGQLEVADKLFMNQVIRSAVDVDKMDFIVRDSYHTGAEYGRVDVSRLIYRMDVVDGNLAVDVRALAALEAFLLARVESFRAIYFHRAVRAVQIMLEMALEKANEELGLTAFESVDEYLAMDDYVTWSRLRECEESSLIIRDLERRRLLKCAYERVFHTRDKFVTSVFTSEKVRELLAEEIAKRAKVDPESVVIDVPSLPSVPYYHSIDIEPMEIPIFRREDGRHVLEKLEDLSRVAQALRVFTNIIRVYTREEHRKSVGEFAEKVFESTPVASF